MRSSMSFLVVLALTVAAAGQELKYVTCSSEDAIRPNPVFATSESFGKPAEGAGTVHKNAVVAPLANSSIKVAIDSAQADAKGPDLLRLDLTGAGKFDNECVIPFKVKTTGDKSLTAEIGPKTLQVKRADKTIAVTVKGQYYKSDTYRYLNLWVSTGADAACKFGEKTCKVRLIDGTGNLKFSDPARPMLNNGRPMWYQPGDTVLVDAGDGTFTKDVWKGFYGQPIIVDGKAYQLTLSADGTKVAAEPAPAEIAKIKVDQTRWNAILAGKKSVVYVAGGKGPVDVPADEYAIILYQVKPDSNSPTSLEGRGVQDKNNFYKTIPVSAGKVADLPIGPPLRAVVEGLKSSDAITLTLNLTDTGGGRITGLLTAGGALPDPPKVTIVDAQGSTVHQATLGYG